MRKLSLLFVSVVTVLAALNVPGSRARAAAVCGQPGSRMEEMICADPAVRARDHAMSVLYGPAVRHGGYPIRERQRRWLAMALSCPDATCLMARYDDGNSVLLETDGARSLVQRYRLRRRDTEGVLILIVRNGWVTYTARETVIGPRGSANGDVYAASMNGTARVDGQVARERKPNGCEVLLQRYSGGWSMHTQHCFDGARADLNERFSS